MSKRILIIDDEPGIRQSLSGILEDEGFVAVAAASAERGLDLLEEGNIDLVLLDIWLGDHMDGLTALGRIRERFSSLPVIMISGHGTIETAVQAARKGACDFIEKPLSYDKIILAVSNGLRLSQLESENRLLRENRPGRIDLIGESPAVLALKQQNNTISKTAEEVGLERSHPHKKRKNLDIVS